MDLLGSFLIKMFIYRVKSLKHKSMITEQMHKEAQEIIKLYELQLRKLAVIKSLPTLEEGMILEYKDLTGRWYEYTKNLQENMHFEPPLCTRVRWVGNVL